MAETAKMRRIKNAQKYAAEMGYNDEPQVLGESSFGSRSGSDQEPQNPNAHLVGDGEIDNYNAGSAGMDAIMAGSAGTAESATSREREISPKSRETRRQQIWRRPNGICYYNNRMK